MLKKFCVLAFILITVFPTRAADDSARQQCIKDCQSVKNQDLKYCEKEKGEKLSQCRESARRDYDACSERCDKKYPIQIKK